MVSVVIDCDDMLGPYDHGNKLEVGMVQKMIYGKKDNYEPGHESRSVQDRRRNYITRWLLSINTSTQQ